MRETESKRDDQRIWFGDIDARNDASWIDDLEFKNPTRPIEVKDKEHAFKLIKCNRVNSRSNEWITFFFFFIKEHNDWRECTHLEKKTKKVKNGKIGRRDEHACLSFNFQFENGVSPHGVRSARANETINSLFDNWSMVIAI